MSEVIETRVTKNPVIVPEVWKSIVRLAAGRTNGTMRKLQTYIHLKRGLRQRMLWF